MNKNISALLSLIFFFIPGFIYSQFKYFESGTGYYVRPYFEAVTDTNYNFALVWPDGRYHREGDSLFIDDIFLKSFDKNLNPLSGQVRVPARTGAQSYVFLPSLSMNNNGELMVAYIGEYNVLQNDEYHRVYYRKFDLFGSPLTPEIRLDKEDSLYNRAHNIKLLLFDNGKFFVSFIKKYVRGVLDPILSIPYQQFRDADGSIIEEITIPVGQQLTELIKLTPETFVIVMDHRYYRKYSDEFVPLGEWTDMVENSEYQNPVQVEAYDDSTLLLFENYKGADTLAFRLYRLRSKTLSDWYIISDLNYWKYRMFGDNSARGKNGELVIIWDDGRNFYPYGDLSTDIYGQIFDKDLNRVGDNFKVNHEPMEYRNWFSDVISLGDHFLAYWLEIQEHYTCTGAPDTTTSGIHRTIIGAKQPFDNPVPGEVFGAEGLFFFCDGYPNIKVEQNYPNPFRHSTTLQFKLFRCGRVTVKVYNLLGQLICTPMDNYLEGNEQFGIEHKVIITMPQQIASGLYFIRISMSGKEKIIKALYLKE